MPLDFTRRFKRKDILEEFSEIEKSEYKFMLYDLLRELENEVKNLKGEMSEKGYISEQRQRIYLEDLKKTTHKAAQVAYNLGDFKLQDMLLSLYVSIKGLPSLRYIQTVEEMEKAVEKIMKHYMKKHEKKGLKSKVPGIFVVLLLSFLLFVFVSVGNFSSSYFVKSSDLISISLVFSFLLTFSAILLLRNL